MSPTESEGFEPEGMDPLFPDLPSPEPEPGPDTHAPSEPTMDLLEAAWGIIANAGGGNWDTQRPDWRTAAEAWRDRYHVVLRAFCDQPAVESRITVTSRTGAPLTIDPKAREAMAEAGLSVVRTDDLVTVLGEAEGFIGGKDNAPFSRLASAAGVE